MAGDEPVRTREARAAAELALVRVAHHYGGTPEFVLLGGLVPDLLCARSDIMHAGTTDIDVQVDLEIAQGSVHTRRLERALLNAEFEPDDARSWRWQIPASDPRAVIKFELLADQDDLAGSQIIHFADCDNLGAVNLPGTGVAIRDHTFATLRARDGGVLREVEIRVTALAGYLLAKTRAYRERRAPKDLYDIAFVVLNNDAGGSAGAASRISNMLDDLRPFRTALMELRAAFEHTTDLGPRTYAEQLLLNHPDSDLEEARADAMVAMRRFCDRLLERVSDSTSPRICLEPARCVNPRA